METVNGNSEHRKRKRRRPVARPISGWVQPCEELLEPEVRISPQLWHEIFREPLDETEAFVGIAPWISSEDVEKHKWTIVPVTLNEDEEAEPDLVQMSTHLPAQRLQLDELEMNPFGRHGKRRDRFEAKITRAQPLPLEKIYISVDGDALERHFQVQQAFGGGFPGNGKQKAVKNAHAEMDTDEELIAAVRQGLRDARIVRQGTLVPIPLAAHPITHVPFPPAQVILCEPVAQGRPTEDTQIIVTRNSSQLPKPTNGPLPVLSHSKSLTDFDNTDGEAYHSALEDDGESGDHVNGLANGDSPESDKSDSSSDTSDDIITMSTPAVPLTRPLAMSSRATATPRGYARRANGISTPGSVFSNITSMTARQAQSKQFNAFPLRYKVPHELLQPPPKAEDDDEARVFVDMKVLVRLGCFSGDWVTIAPIASNGTEGPLLTSLSCDAKVRSAKIFGLPDLSVISRSSNPSGDSQGRRDSTVTAARSVGGALNAWLPPSVLYNLGAPDRVRISVLQDAQTERLPSRSRAGGRKINASALPPTAEEMTISKVSTPVSTEKALQNGIFSALKYYFESRRRLVKQGDMLAFLLDTQTARMFHDQSSEGDMGIEEQLYCTDLSGSSSSCEIAWCKVESVRGPEPLEASDMNSGLWGGTFCIDPTETRMRQAGTEQCKTIAQPINIVGYLAGSEPAGQASLSNYFGLAPLKSHTSTVQGRLRELLAAATSPRAIHLQMDPVIILLHSHQRSTGKSTLAHQAADHLGLHTFSIDAYDLLAEGTGGGDVKSEALLTAKVARALASGAAFTTILLQHVEALTADRMVLVLRDIIKDVRVLIATTSELDQVTEGIRSLFTHEIEVSPPDEAERAQLLRSIVEGKRLQVATGVDLAAIALKTAALVVGNLVEIVERAVINRQARLEKLASALQSPPTKADINDVSIAGGINVRCIIKEDFDVAIESARKSFADSIGAPRIPNVQWTDVGGLSHIKSALQETIELPLSRPELFAKGLKKRSGMLFYGPPGTGKTLVAKAVATEFSLNFFSVKGPELLNMYIGESEANVRRVFQRARDAKPCVVFFDELDSVAPKRGNQGDSGGVMDRIVSQLLAELDGMSDGDEGSGSVFVIGATNRPDLLDPALLRPGRFDKMLYLGVSDTHDKQMTILEALTRKFKLHPDLQLRRVAEALPFTFTGADLYALCSDAMLKAITRQARAVDAKIAELKEREGREVSHAWFFDHRAIEEDIAVLVREDDFLAAAGELVPSVSAKELEHYRNVQREFEGNAKSSAPSDTAPLAPSNISAVPNGHLKPPLRRAKSSKQKQAISADSAKPTSKIKGKGKATVWDSDDEEDDGFVTSNDFATPERRQSHDRVQRNGGSGKDDSD